MPKAPSGVRTPWRWPVSPCPCRDGGEHAVAPADEQPNREEDDQRRDRGLRALLDPLGEEPLGEEDRQAEGDERDGVAEAPPGPEPGGRPGRPLATGRDERRHRGEVVGVGRVTEPEQRRDEDHHEHGAAL